MAVREPYYDPVTKVVHGAAESESFTDPRGLGWFLFEALQKWGAENRIAQIMAETGSEDSYQSLFSRCVRTAIGMKRLGLEKGDIITICSHHHLNTVVPMLAAYFLGVITAPLDPSLSLDECKHLLNLVQPKYLFASTGCEDLMMASLQGLPFDCEVISFGAKSENNRCFDWFLQEWGNEEEFKPQVTDDLSTTCMIMFSSGTTGLPKGICLTHKLLLKTIGRMIRVETYFAYTSLYWVSAVFIGVSSVGHGSRRLLCESFHPQLFCDYLTKYQVEYVFIAPVQAINLLPHLNPKENVVKFVAIGGSRLLPSYLQQFRDAIPNAFVTILYGQTEVGMISHMITKDKNYIKLESSGLPVPGSKIKIVDPETEEDLPLKSVGEIRVKTSSGLNGYYKLDSSGIWDSNGFVKTGDLGYFDDDLCLFVTDRIKEMFKYKSWHIVPAELEIVLQSHPAVVLSVVIGIPHETDDNHALGVVTLHPNANVTSKEIELFVEERVSERYRLRAGVMILDGDKLPLTPTGKINRWQMKKMVMKTYSVNKHV